MTRRKWRLRNFIVVASVLAGCAHQFERHSLPERTSADNGRELRRVHFDSPDQADAHYVKRRLGAGMQSIPIERLIAGRAKMVEMPHYASGLQRRFASEREARSTAPQTTWTSLGPGNIGGRTRALLIHATQTETMWAAAAGGGVWKSSNGGTSWAPTADSMANLAVVALASHPSAPDTIYAGTGEGFYGSGMRRGAGIFKSTNGGGLWSQLPSTNNSNFHFVNSMHVAPVNTQRVVAATGSGVFVSNDAGATFTRRLNASTCQDLAVTANGGNDVWLVSCGGFDGGTVYRSLDAVTWTPILSEIGMGRTSLAIHGSRAYALASSNSAGFDRNGDGLGDYSDQLHAFYRSNDSGATWNAVVRNNSAHHGNTLLLSGYFSCNDLNAYGGQGWYDNVVAIDPINPDIVWVGGVHLFRSTDGGANWGRGDGSNYHGIHPDQHALVFHPNYNGTTNQVLFNAQDGGIYKTANARAAVAMLPAATGGNCAGTTAVAWTDLNHNYGSTQFYHGMPFPNGTTYIGGTQDNSTILGTDVGGMNGWSPRVCGDGGYSIVKPTNPNIVYAGCQLIGLNKSTDGGMTFVPTDTGDIYAQSPGELSEFIPPWVIDPNAPSRIWFGGMHAWRSDDEAGNWTRASTPFDPPGASSFDLVTAIAIAPGNSNVVLMGSAYGIVYRTTAATSANSSTAWASVALPGYVSSIAFAPSDGNIAYATVSQYGVAHVHRSSDGGQTWTSVNGSGITGLPDVPTLTAAIHPGNANQVWVGTDIGVFVSTDGGANWAAELTGFPNVATEWLAINGSGESAQLFAFTHGRGAFKLSLSSHVHIYSNGFE